MADNVTLNPGTGGAVVATDDDGVAQHQYVKVEFGGDGVFTKVTTSAGLPTDPLDRATRDCGKIDIAMGQAAHDAAATTVDPILVGGYASAAAPLGVSADGDAVRQWHLLNGAQCVNLTAAGALIPGDATNGLTVNLAANNDVTITGTVAVTQSGTWDEIGINDSGNSITVDNNGTFVTQLDGAALTALQLIDNPVVVDDAAFTPATSSVMMAGFEADEGTTDSVDEGDAGAARMTLDRKVITTPQPHTTGGCSIFRSLDLDETEEDVKTTAGQVYGLWVSNTATATRFVKFYNATAANVTVGTTTPVLTLPIPGNSSDDVTGLFSSAMGIMFDTAICVAATTGVADSDTGAPGVNDVVINVFYK